MKYELLCLLKNKRLLCFALVLLLLAGAAAYYSPKATQNTIEQYNETISSLLSLSEKRLNEAVLNGENGFARNYYEKLIKVYTALQSAKLPIAEDELTGWGEFLSCGYIFPLLLVCCIAFCVIIFGREKRHGVFSVLYASKHGRGAFAAVKLAAGLLVCLSLAVLFSLAGLIGAALRYGLSGGAQYIQSLTTFVYCPVALKVWQAAVVSTLISALAALSVSLFSGIVVYITESDLFAYALASLFSVASFFINRATYLNSNAFFKNCNLFAATAPDVYFGKYICLNVFGTPFPVLAANILISALSFVLFSAAFFLLHGKRVSLIIKLPSLKLKKAEKQRKVRKLRARSPYGFELLKISSSSLTVLLLAALILFRVGDCVYKVYDGVAFSELIYAEYCRMWSGETTEQKSMEIRAENARISDAIDSYADYMVSLSMHTEYTGDVEEVLANLEYAQAHYTPLQRFQERYIYAQATDGKIFYESGWLMLFNSGIDPILCIAVLYLCLFLTSYERAHKTVATVYASRYGHGRVYALRLLSLLTVCMALTLIFELCRALPAVINYQLDNGDYLLTYLSEYEGFPFNLSLSFYTAILYTAKTLAAAALCAVSVGAERLFVKRGLL